MKVAALFLLALPLLAADQMITVGIRVYSKAGPLGEVVAIDGERVQVKMPSGALLWIKAAEILTVAPPPTPSPDRPIETSAIVNVPGATKAQLYRTALAWFGKTFESLPAVMEVQDAEGGRLVGRPLWIFDPTTVTFLGNKCLRGPVRYSITVEAKDGRYRYRIGDFRHEGTPCGGSRDPSVGPITENPKPPRALADLLAVGGDERMWEALRTHSRLTAESDAKHLETAMAGAATRADEW